jgi:dethiobiotin synthetase
VVVLGTGTNVGKTYVTSALLRAVRERRPNEPLLGLKPVETGGDGGYYADAALLERLSGGAPAPKPHPLFGFRDPVSPHLAARREGRVIEVAAIRQWVDGATSANTAGLCLVETAGGALSPLTSSATNLDLALALEPALWVLVVPDCLGALHDARATLLALSKVARAPDFVVVSAARGPDAATGTTAAELRELGLADAIAVLERNDALRVVASAPEAPRGATAADLGEHRRANFTTSARDPAKSVGRLADRLCSPIGFNVPGR